MTDGADETVETALAPLHTNAASHSHADQAPGWFKNLVATPIESRTFPVTVRGRPIGSVTILSEPADEIDESWDYALELLEATFFANVIALAALFLFFGKALTPLKSLAEGLIDLEGKDYSVRLKSPSVREFAIITKHFNLTAEALAVAQAANHALNRNLVDAQDRERRRIALELHDEMGPCLFALEANATSVAHMTKDLPNGRIHERALDVMQLVERIQSVNRRMLDSLRPIALGHMPLGKCLENLLFDFMPNDSGAAVDTKIGALQASYGVRIDLTLYRCVQEGLCNALRHAQASRIVVILDEISDPRGALISLRIEDDGIGLRFPVPSGTGLSGMRERVEALDGSFDLRSSPKGTILAILLPLEAEVPLAPVLRNSSS
jgi:two-component system sensor histidine kinase UhpB